MPTQRYRLTIAYRGTHYHGWQSQPPNPFYKKPIPHGEGLPTIQEKVARALMHIVRHPLNLVGSSRTDAGVHAKAQFAHFDTDQIQIPPEGMRRSANTKLPDDILIRAIEPVDPAWDAIHSTLSKRYQYAIWNHVDRHPFFHEYTWHRWQKLDVDAMAAGAAHFVGTHDFTSFAHPQHGRATAVRTMLSCTVTSRGPLIVVGVEGTGFLWNMVRIMVGTLVQIGLGQLRADDIPAMLRAKNRTASGNTAPAQGLFLHWIKSVDKGHARPEAPSDNEA